VTEGGAAPERLAVARSLLFAPAGDERKLRKALTGTADAVVADLEDGTAPDAKAAARATAAALLAAAAPGRVRGLRINPPDTEWFDDDLRLVESLVLDFVMLPKATPETVTALGSSGPPVIAIVETATGLRCAYEIAAEPRVLALALGSHDLGAELRTTPRPDGLELLHARSQVVADSAAAGVRAPFDTVYLDVRDTPGLEAECRLARTLGFRASSASIPSSSSR
jgi:citrate lyase beta subunit